MQPAIGEVAEIAGGEPAFGGDLRAADLDFAAFGNAQFHPGDDAAEADHAAAFGQAVEFLQIHPQRLEAGDERRGDRGAANPGAAQPVQPDGGQSRFEHQAAGEGGAGAQRPVEGGALQGGGSLRRGGEASGEALPDPGRGDQHGRADFGQVFRHGFHAFHQIADRAGRQSEVEAENPFGDQRHRQEGQPFITGAKPGEREPGSKLGHDIAVA